MQLNMVVIVIFTHTHSVPLRALGGLGDDQGIPICCNCQMSLYAYFMYYHIV